MRRLTVLAVILAVAVLGACDDGNDTQQGEATGEQPATPGGATAPGGASGNGGDATAPGATPAPVPTAPTPGRSETPTPTAPSRPAVNPSGPVGSFGPVILDPAVALRLDILVEDGAVPTDRTLAALRAVLGDVSGKAVVTGGPVKVPASGPWTADKIRQVAADLGGRSTGGEAVLRLLFLAGEFADDTSTVGVAVNATTAAVFTEKVERARGLLGDRARFETAVATHELGHLLGLVDLVLDTGREDPEHPGHSRSRESVMYWAVESDLIGSLLGGGPPTDFDAADRADLAEIRRRRS
jgi:hypothetical protein